MIINAYAKINLSLDVLGRREDGYHNISSLMQDIGLHDIVNIEKCSGLCAKYKSVHCRISKVDVYLCTSVDTIPLDENNLAIKGARAIIEAIDGKGLDAVSMYIDKQLPVAAGIAGGSGNAAAAMLGINALVGYPLSLRELMSIGARVGADVPYSLMMNAKKNQSVLSDLPGIEEASSAAMMGGIGDIVEPVEPIKKYIIMANPGISVSTRDAYEAIDALQEYGDAAGLFTNQLEKYTLANYPEAAALKTAMEEHLNADLVLMSGSGPTMVAYYDDEETAKNDYDSMKNDDWLGESGRAWLTVTGGNN
ncbi:MAG: 4-(cytidine 5'-diphospho)-2-C-methyl-D-erythritol kinase [Clostridiales bacterium]|nr:4-(cytidine 5'-diphospho)-2-C-methyl-D-erythritol kinase [Candidatus Crickella equi]